MRTSLQYILNTVEFCFIFLIGKIFGITYVVKYLRNPTPKVALKLLRTFGASIGEQTTIKRSVRIDNAFEDQDSKGDFSNLTIGRNCYIGDGAYFDLADKISIGDNVVLSAETAILTHADCNRSTYLSKIYPRLNKSVVIHNDVWICFGVKVLAGVVVSSHSVVLANSLVTKNVESKILSGGSPSEKIHSLEN